MKDKILITIFCVLFVMGGSLVSSATEIEFDFEHGNQGWGIPEWTDTRDDYVGEWMEITTEKFLKHNRVLKVQCNFPKKSWAAAIVEFEALNDGLKSNGEVVSADIYVPRKARRKGLRARIIITVGDEWKVLESESIPLKGGKWNKITARFDEFNSADGKGANSFSAQNIKKIAIRIEREATAWDPMRRYKGPVYIDNVAVR